MIKLEMGLHVATLDLWRLGHPYRAQLLDPATQLAIWRRDFMPSTPIWMVADHKTSPND